MIKSQENYFKKIREDFPILNKKIDGKNLIFVDNASSTQKPKILISSIVDFYENNYSNIHRGNYYLSEKSSSMFENTRKKVANFINSEMQEVIFTCGATNSLNLIGNGILDELFAGDEILLSVHEHHSNLVIWQQVAKKKNLVLKYVNLTSDFKLDLDDLKLKLSSKTKIVSIGYVSNVLGIINPINEISFIIKKKNSKIIFIVDAAAAIPHIKIDVKKLNVDFLTFSAHKMCGASGVGVLFGKYEMLQKLNPLSFGGNMIDEVSFENSSFAKIPEKFEAGTSNIEGVISFGNVLDYLENIGYENINLWEKELIGYFLKKVKKLKNIEVYGPLTSKDRVGIFSFNVKGIHSHDVSTILDKEGISIRGGHHCCMPLHEEILKIPASNRISFYFYNTKQEINKIIEILEKIEEIYNSGDFLL